MRCKKSGNKHLRQFVESLEQRIFLSGQSITGVASLAAGSGVIVPAAAPSTPTDPDLAAASDSGTSNSDDITNVTTPTFTGSADPDVTVRVFSDGVQVGSGIAAGGNYAITVSSLTNGPHAITADAVDALNNNSGLSGALNVVIDTVAPAAPSTPDLATASDSGTSNSDNITNVTTLRFTGTAEAGSRTSILAGASLLGSALTSIAGNYNVLTIALANGTYDISATATDVAGNISAASGSLSVTVDTIAPTAPSVPDLTNSSDSGISNADDITSVTAATFAGLAEAGSTVRVFSDGILVGAGPATGGNYAVASAALADGLHKITTTATDLAGNLSPASPGLLITIDTAAPTVDIVDVSPDPRNTPVNQIGILFNEAVAGLSLGAFQLTRDGGANLFTGLETISSSDALHWTLGNLAPATAPIGNYTLALTAAGSGVADLAGNALATGAADSWAVSGTVVVNGDQGTANDDDIIRLVRDQVDPSLLNIFVSNVNGSTAFSVFFPTLQQITVNGLGGIDTLSVDQSLGDVVPPGGLYFNGGEAIGNTLRVTGTPGNDTVVVEPTQVTVNNTVIHYIDSNAMLFSTGDGDDTLTIPQALSFSPAFTGGTGNDTLNILAGSYTFNDDASETTDHLKVVAANNATVNFAISQHLASLTLQNTAAATLMAGGSAFIRTDGLSLDPGATLDLSSGSLILQSTAANKVGDLAKVSGLIGSGRRAGAWDGKGIISSVAAVQPNRLTGLSVIVNDRGNGTKVTSTLAGENVDVNTVLVKYTWNGDADLTGKIDADDYFLIDIGFATHLHDYRNGDFDFNGSVDADDYFLIDRAFAGQTGILATATPQAASVARHHRHHSAKQKH
jgi:hypothetical protein